VLEANREAILARLHDGALVLDVGGGARPFERADWVLDMVPYGDRGLLGVTRAPSGERFDERTWVVRDMCDHEPWPFSDGQLDFALCTHTLEDVRDPIWVCHELNRVARAGYIEVPSRLEEQSYGFQGPWVGWSHHRWLVDIAGDEITFVFKHHIIHGRARNHFPVGYRYALSARERVQWLSWEGSFRYREWLPTDNTEIDAYLADFVRANWRELPASRRGRITRRIRHGQPFRRDA
jgi:hypothetical protein